MVIIQARARTTDYSFPVLIATVHLFNSGLSKKMPPKLKLKVGSAVCSRVRLISLNEPRPQTNLVDEFIAKDQAMRMARH